jgi:hypothetical protein
MLISRGNQVAPPAGVVVKSFLRQAVGSLPFRTRGGPATELVLHESVTRSAKATARVLKNRGLGVHLVIDADGTVYQHGDLASHRMSHARGHNARSIGIEVVNPFYPRYLRKGSPWSRVIDAPWAHGGSYVVPTYDQAEATARIVRLLTSGDVPGVVIPRDWIGHRKDRFAMERVPGATGSRPGIYAHTYWSHSDGAFVALYCWLRLSACLAPSFAYERAIALATGARKSVDVSPPVTAFI